MQQYRIAPSRSYRFASTPAKAAGVLVLAAVLALAGQAAEAAFIDVELETVLEYDAAGDSILGDLPPGCVDGLTCERSAAMSDDMSAAALMAGANRAPGAMALAAPPADGGHDMMVVDIGISVAEVYDPSVQDRVLPSAPTDDMLAALLETGSKAVRPAKAHTATSTWPRKQYRTPHRLAASISGSRP